jgi:hypothetical protein
MPDNLTLYLPLPAAEVEIGGSAVLTHGAPTIQRVGSARVILNVMAESAVSDHLRGLAGFVATQCVIRDADFLARVQRVRACVGLVIEPHVDHFVRAWAFSLARRAGGFVFDGVAFLDGDETVLAGPPLPRADASDPTYTAPDTTDPSDAPEPADANQVRLRAWGLMAVIQRAFLEDASITGEQFAEHYASLSAWIIERGVENAFDRDEQASLATNQGALDSKRASDATWLTEGLGVLAWALGVAELRAHDEEYDLFALHEALGFLDDVPPALDPPRIRARAELERKHGQLLAIHWRLREFRLRPVPIDFAGLAGRGVFDVFDIDGIPLADGDLVVHGRPISTAPAGAVQHASSIALERHRAIEWLMDARTAYSNVDTST